MHIQAKQFVDFVKEQLSNYFINKIVLDVGSGDINGNNNYLSENCDYNGNDVVEAKNVTIVSKTKDLPFNNKYFDTIISTECFEHDPTYKESLVKIYDMLKDDGFGRPEHGTRRTTPQCSYSSITQMDDMQDYYKNLTIKDINEVLNLNTNFSCWNSYYNSESKDLYFVGIKKGSEFNDKLKIPEYKCKYVHNNKNNM